MTVIHFQNPTALFWLWLVPFAAVLFTHAAAKRRQAVRAFGFCTRGVTGRKREAFSSCIAIALVVLALARPSWNVREKQLEETGRDVIFLLDVSRSMLARDMHPNRLANAKTAILDCIEEFSGDRVALVLFAGSTEIRCPLTVDYDYFRMALRQASPDSVGAGGTMIAHAVERTIDKLIDQQKAGIQDVVLITDGEDMVDGPDEVDAVKKLAQAGVRLIAIGVGDRTRGSRIALEETDSGSPAFMKHGKMEVWTKLHSETLRRMAEATENGVYFEVATGPFNLRQIYRQAMEHAQRVATGRQTVESYKDKFHLFLGTAVLVLLLSRRCKPTGRNMTLCLLLVFGTAEANPAKPFSQGNRSYAAGDFAGAIEAYMEAMNEAPESAEIRFNLGNALYRSGAYVEAGRAYEAGASLAQSDGLRGRSCYNLGNSLASIAAEIRKDDPHAAVEYCRQAAWSFRTALTHDTSLVQAAYNLEMCQRLAAAIDEDIRKQEEQEHQQSELFEHIRAKLEEFIERQGALIDSQPVGASQQQLELETRELAKVMEESGLHEDIVFPDGTKIEGPLKETWQHTVGAATAMALPDQPVALAELVAALGSAPQNTDRQGESENDGSEENEDFDMDFQESDEGADMYEESDPFGDFSDYEEIRGVPPPNKTDRDILAEEIRNQQRRKNKKPGEYKPVEKDW